MGKQRVFGQDLTLTVGSVNGQSQSFVAEIDSFSYKMDDQLKENASLGEAGVGTIDLLDNGGSATFEAKKSDSAMEAFFDAMHRHMRADSDSGNTPSNRRGKRGKAPYVSFVRTITYTDGSKSIQSFSNCVFHAFEESSDGNKNEIPEKWECRFESVRFRPSGGGESAQTIGGLGGSAFVNAMAILNNQANNGEVSAVGYSKENS